MFLLLPGLTRSCPIHVRHRPSGVGRIIFDMDYRSWNEGTFRGARAFGFGFGFRKRRNGNVEVRANASSETEEFKPGM